MSDVDYLLKSVTTIYFLYIKAPENKGETRDQRLGRQTESGGRERVSVTPEIWTKCAGIYEHWVNQ